MHSSKKEKKKEKKKENKTLWKKMIMHLEDKA